MSDWSKKLKSVFDEDITIDDLKKAKAGFWIKMKAFVRKIPFAKDAVALYYLIRDPKMAFAAKSTAAVALLYFISPIDLVPDAIPLAGLLDDAAVMAAALGMIGTVINPFRKKADEWEERGQKIEEEIKEADVIEEADKVSEPPQA
ncbi:MAG: DUF1232 domain-containing protein [Planctomycetes bacterium]|nr:DUF1232 domain-containing protein [Planctomycetota bacterium]